MNAKVTAAGEAIEAARAEGRHLVAAAQAREGITDGIRHSRGQCRRNWPPAACRRTCRLML
jgi:hypothetical protein